MSAESPKLLISREELFELREGRDFRRIWDRCLRYVLRCREYGRTLLSAQDDEEIVSEALKAQLSVIFSAESDPEGASISLARELNRNLARIGARRALWAELQRLSQQAEVEGEDPEFIGVTHGEDLQIQAEAGNPDLGAEINSSYESIGRLAHLGATPQRDAQVEQTFARLRVLQHLEAKQFQQQFESNLMMPLDAGASIIGRSRNLRKQLEDLATTDSSSK